VKCIHCHHDSTFKERSDGRCAGCRHPFAFEPKRGDPLTDPAFQAAIDAVSAGGRVRWGVEHLYYEVNRQAHHRASRASRGLLILAGVLAVIGGFALLARSKGWAVVLGIGAVLVVVAYLSRQRTRPVSVDLERFNRMWARWQEVHEREPKGLILRREASAPPKAVEPDVGDYSFDRAVICDRARTVDLLLANNFHFENNCAVLSIEGYPPGPFALVRQMLKRNPKLHVFALHDATPAGCRLAYRLAYDSEWFKGHGRVIDVGLRPSHARPFNGLLLAARGPVTQGQSVTAREAGWLGRWALELAAIRPEQVLKRLYKAINRASGRSSDDWDSDGSTSPGGGAVDRDDDAFSADAADSDGSADGFG